MVWVTSPGGCHLCPLIPICALFEVIVNLHLPPRAIFSKLEKQTLTLSYLKPSGLLHPWVCRHSSVDKVLALQMHGPTTHLNKELFNSQIV